MAPKVSAVVQISELTISRAAMVRYRIVDVHLGTDMARNDAGKYQMTALQHLCFDLGNDELQCQYPSRPMAKRTTYFSITLHSQRSFRVPSSRLEGLVELMMDPP